MKILFNPYFTKKSMVQQRKPANKSIESLDYLEKMLEEERNRPKYINQVKIIDRPNYSPIIINGSEVANYGTHGFPTMKNVTSILKKAWKENYRPITVIFDSDLRYLLVEHEEIKNLDTCACKYCTAVRDQKYSLDESFDVTFLECLPKVDYKKELLSLAENSGSRIVSNEKFHELKSEFVILSKKNWQIHYKLGKDHVNFW